jgi:hypothetical protein
MTIDDDQILDRVVVEETSNALLDAEADRLCKAKHYERSEARRDTRAGHYERKLQSPVVRGLVTMRESAAPRTLFFDYSCATIE